jgi:tripartite-type tricarboxylate transporter receptor subunit TctC
VLNGALYSLPYNVLDDFAPIALLVATPLILFARKTMAAKDLDELITWLKANPDKASAGIYAPGPHLVTRFFEKETRAQFELVPYRGEAPALQGLTAGHIDLLFAPSDGLSLMRAGSIKAYAVTSERRLAGAPTVAEIGYPNLAFSAWFALFAPKNTPKEIIAKLNAATVEALADPGVRSRFADLGFDVFPREQQTPEALGTLQKAEAAKWWPLIKEFGIKAE